MAITVRRLAGHKDLGLTLVAGRENADRVISWAHAIELADPTPYLSGGELVMTTGLKMGPTSDEQYEYVARLSAAGVVALAFDTGTNFDRVPDGVLSAGDALGLPILQVPADTPFIAITRAVIDELTADQLRVGPTRRRPAGDFRACHPAGRHTGCGGLTRVRRCRPPRW